MLSYAYTEKCKLSYLSILPHDDDDGADHDDKLLPHVRIQLKSICFRECEILYHFQKHIVYSHIVFDNIAVRVRFLIKFVYFYI